MRSEREIRERIAALEEQADRYRRQHRFQDRADVESDAATLRWVLGESS